MRRAGVLRAQQPCSGLRRPLQRCCLQLLGEGGVGGRRWREGVWGGMGWDGVGARRGQQRCSGLQRPLQHCCLQLKASRGDSPHEQSSPRTPPNPRPMLCFVQWAQCFLIARLLFAAWARVHGRKWHFGQHLDGCGGRGLLSALTSLIAIAKYRAHRTFVRVNYNCPR